MRQATVQWRESVGDGNLSSLINDMIDNGDTILSVIPVSYNQGSIVHALIMYSYE